jgi:hypothetical protein
MNIYSELVFFGIKDFKTNSQNQKKIAGIKWLSDHISEMKNTEWQTSITTKVPKDILHTHVRKMDLFFCTAICLATFIPLQQSSRQYARRKCDSFARIMTTALKVNRETAWLLIKNVTRMLAYKKNPRTYK